MSIDFEKVLRCLVSEHQRDLVGSSIMRELPGVVVLTQYQIERISKVLLKITIDKKSLMRNFKQSEKLVMVEPLYLILQLYGYEGDAHELVNHTLVPKVKKSNTHLIDELIYFAQEDEEIKTVLEQIPREMFNLLYNPHKYTGKAEEKTMEVVKKANDFVKENKST